MPSPMNPTDLKAHFEDTVNRAGDIFRKMLESLAQAALAEGVAIGVRDTAKIEAYGQAKRDAIENAVDNYKRALRQ